MPPPSPVARSIKGAALECVVAALTVLTLVCCPPRAAHAQAIATEPGRLHGSYLQLLSAHGKWTADDWNRLFGHFRALRLSELVVQWSAFDDIAFYPSPSLRSVASAPIESILTAASNAQMRVLVGLTHDSEYWQRIRPQSADVDAYLQWLHGRAITVATELASLVAKQPAFEGWYIPLEVDDVNWIEPARRAMLFGHLQRLSAELRRLTPGARIAISGFSNARLDPQGLEAFWMELLGQAPAIDIVLFQDGVGVHKLRIPEVPMYMAAVRNAVAHHGRSLRAVVETFRQTAGPPINDAQFSAVPAPIGQLQQQIRIANKFASSIVAFSVPEYLSPIGGDAAASLYAQYLGTLRTRQ